MRTHIVIDDRLMARAMHASGAATKREVVERGLELVLALGGQPQMRRYRGKLKCEDALERIRRDSPR
ncbi:MAG: type II toxin-antitoxin system VapB family antitoxin [Candidatus Binataceae bacterium]